MSRTECHLGTWNGRCSREERMGSEEDEWQSNEAIERQTRPLIPQNDHLWKTTTFIWHIKAGPCDAVIYLE
jgi:hypothetical protein